MTTLREVAEAIMEQLKGGWVCESDPVAQDLKAALAEPVQEPLTIERLRDALVASRIIPPAAVEDPDEYDDGLTLFRIEALHRRIT